MDNRFAGTTVDQGTEVLVFVTRKGTDHADDKFRYIVFLAVGSNIICQVKACFGDTSVVIAVARRRGFFMMVMFFGALVISCLTACVVSSALIVGVLVGTVAGVAAVVSI